MCLHVHPNCLMRRSKDAARTKEGRARSGNRVCTGPQSAAGQHHLYCISSALLGPALHRGDTHCAKTLQNLSPKACPGRGNFLGKMKLKGEEEKLSEVYQSPNIYSAKAGCAGHCHRQPCQGSLALLPTCHCRSPYASHMTLKFNGGESRQQHIGQPHQLLKQDLLFPDFSEASMEPANNTTHPALPKTLPDSLDFSIQCPP